MQSESAFLDDLIRGTWNGQVAWKLVKIGQHCANFSEFNVRAFITYHNYQISPGGIISERNHHVQRQLWFLIYRELQAPRAWKKELWDAIGFRAWEVDSSQNDLLKEQGYLIRFDGGDPRGQTILYQEADHRLMIYVEMVTSGNARWRADMRSLRMWVDPVDREIEPEKQVQISTRIIGWSESLGTPVEF
jgi:hypothetical protein